MSDDVDASQVKAGIEAILMVADQPVSPAQLAEIIGLSPTPMSWHHQAVMRPGEGMHAVAHAPDGTIEATESADHRHLVSVQWHPELTAADDPSQQALFDNLVTTITTARQPA